MAKNSVKGFIGGFFSLLVISILVFLCIYFFLPDLSVQYFGMTFNNEKYLSDKLDEFVQIIPGEADDQLVSYLSSPKAKEDMSALLSELGNDIKAFVDYISSPAGQAMLQEKAEQAHELIEAGQRALE